MTDADLMGPHGMRRRRHQLKETQEEAAAAIGVALSSVQRWELGRQRPHLRTQKRIATHFRVPLRTVDQWFCGDHDCPSCRPTRRRGHGSHR
ncbi:MAG: helix-turn-helix transcriptional regulator [Pseudonocardia sp.]|nr:helix-turn-helix transcriptional regulator [Pseudonocardia sp.]